MPELTRVERERLDKLKGKQPWPPSVAPDSNLRTESEEIEFRGLAGRFEAEERLDVLRKQPERSHDELDEMRTLGAPEDGVLDEERKLAAAEAAAKAEEDEAEAEADKAASLPVQQRLASERLAREASAVQERAAREPVPGDAQVGVPLPSTGGLADQATRRLAVLRGTPNRTLAQNREMRELEEAAG